jgi:hypothetical protein
MRPLISIVLPLCCGLSQAVRAPTKVDQGSVIPKAFDRRVSDYVKLRKAVRSRIHRLKPTQSAEAIELHEHSLAQEIRKARRDARRGNIFTPEISAQFRLLIGQTMSGPDAVRIQESLKHAEPVRLQSIRVNAAYPAGIPLQSTPPSLLLNLPDLPPGLEYRIVGRRLILRDIEANLIVDYVDGAIP